MEKIYKNRQSAMRAATRHFLDNDCVAILADKNNWGELLDDNGHIAGEYPFIIVVESGESTETNPFGDSWEQFWYES